MAISRPQADHIVERDALAARATRFSEQVIEREQFWYYPVGFVGSHGVIVDRADGRLSVMGSSPSVSLEDCFWGHLRGLSGDDAILKITAVHDLRASVAVLFRLVAEGPPPVRNPSPRRAWLEERLANLPCTFAPQSYWLSIPELRRIEEEGPFRWEIASALPSDGMPPGDAG